MKRHRRAAWVAASDSEPSFLNIVPMLDVVTIVLVFLLKTMSQVSASVPQSDDLKLPASMLASQPAEEGVVVTISKTQILVGDARVVNLPRLESMIHTGAGAANKRGPNDLYIVPLGTVLRSARDTDVLLRKAGGRAPGESEAIVVADETTPYRLLSEVLFTLGQQSFGKFHLLVVQNRATE